MRIPCQLHECFQFSDPAMALVVTDSKSIEMILHSIFSMTAIPYFKRDMKSRVGFRIVAASLVGESKRFEVT